MVDFPPYIKIIAGNAPRRASGPARASTAKPSHASDAASSAGRARENAGVVTLVGRENRVASSSQLPTSAEAAEALSRLQEDLPALGQAVGDVHANLDRRRILDLLAPLLDS